MCVSCFFFFPLKREVLSATLCMYLSLPAYFIIQHFAFYSFCLSICFFFFLIAAAVACFRTACDNNSPVVVVAIYLFMILFVPPPPPLSACLCVCVCFFKKPLSPPCSFSPFHSSRCFAEVLFFFFSLSLTLFGAVVILHREGVTAYNTALLLLLLSFDFIASLLLYKYVYTELSLFRNGSARSRVSAFDYPRWWWQ